MSVRRDIRVELQPEDVLRRQGFPPGAPVRPQIRRHMAATLAEVDESRLLEPAIAYRVHGIREITASRVCLDDGTILDGRLSGAMEGAETLALLVCTIGHRLEERVRAYSASHQTLRALLLDGIGSAAVDALAAEACRVLAGVAAANGATAGGRISPGMPRFGLAQQASVLDLAGADEIGVCLTRGGLMWPQKSASMVVGIGTDVATYARAEVCDRCRLNRRCAYRLDAPLRHGHRRGSPATGI